MPTMQDKDRQNKWKQKQKSRGKKSVTVMLEKYAKDLIDEERKRTKLSTASIIEGAIIQYLGLSAAEIEISKHGRQPVPTEVLQEIANDLLGIVRKIERLSGIKAVPPGATITLKELIRKHPSYKKVISIINLMKRSGGTPGSIASTLNAGGSKTFRGDEKWCEADIRELFEEFDQDALTLLEYENPRRTKR
jgi:hypothetical protein